MKNDEWMDTQNDMMAKIIASGQFPAFAEMATAGEVELNLDSLFEFGLARLLDGLAGLIQQHNGPAHQGVGQTAPGQFAAGRSRGRS
jgi:hypothetical protein